MASVKNSAGGNAVIALALANGKTRMGRIMAEKTGEIARESSNYRCTRCHQVTGFAQGDLIPACPHCGFETFDISNPRFERQDGSLGPHEPG
jgi:Zn finger protein HypA/HybF involved in hydrogenase expression